MKDLNKKILSSIDREVSTVVKEHFTKPGPGKTSR